MNRETITAMCKDGIPHWLIGRVEREIDKITDPSNPLVVVFADVAIDDSDESVVAFTYGCVMVLILQELALRNKELTDEIISEIGLIIERRKPDIVKAFQE